MSQLSQGCLRVECKRSVPASRFVEGEPESEEKNMFYNIKYKLHKISEVRIKLTQINSITHKKPAKKFGQFKANE